MSITDFAGRWLQGAARRLRRGGGGQAGCFATVAFDPDRFAADLARPPAGIDCTILFTPRSGSSWLTEVLAATGQLGRAQEFFNPQLVPRLAEQLNADRLDRYVEMLRRRRQKGGVFSFEITIFQLHRVFVTEAAFLRHFPATGPLYYLRREDIVLQAVSLAKAMQTRVFHAARASADEIARADADFVYDAGLIADRLGHILDQERACEAFFAAHGLAPRRLSYEANVAAGATALAGRFLSELRGLPPVAAAPAGRHVKIGSERNLELAGRFRADRPELLRRLDETRPPLRFDPPPG